MKVTDEPSVSRAALVQAVGVRADSRRPVDAHG